MSRSSGLEFGSLMREHRKALYLNQAELAQRLGFSASYVAKLERSDRPPPQATVAKLVAALELEGDSKAEFLEAARIARARHLESKGLRETARILGRLPVLPSRTRAVVGRSDEIQGIIAKLAEPGAVINIAGEPAIGKTTVALAVAHHYLNEGRVVLWGDAREGAAKDVAQVESLLWHSLVGERMPVSELHRRKRLSTALSDHEPLVVLDNLESAAEFDGILDLAQQIGKGASILVTSRRAVHARHGDNVPLLELSEDEGIELFEKVGAAYDRQAVTESERQAIEFICVDTLERHPGAIEIAASLWKGWPLEAILRGLRKRAMEVLEDPHRTDENRSMRISIGLSYDLLHQENLEAWELFPRLSVFRASFSYQAVENVAGMSDVLSALSFLVDRSLIRFDGRRHAIHSVVREFALEKLGKHRPECELRAAEYFLAFAQEHESDHGRLDEEKGNLFATMDWAEAHGEYRSIALELADLLSFFMHRRGLWVERVQRIGRALKIAELSGDVYDAARLCFALGNAYRNQGDDEKAEEYMERGLALAQQLDDPGLVGGGLFLLAELAFRAEEHPRVQELATRALGLMEQAGATDQLPFVYSLLGSCESELGQPEKAYTFFEKGLSLACELEDSSVVSILLEDLCRLDIETKDYQRAEKRAQEYQELARAMGDPLAEGIALLIWGTLLWETGRAEAAMGYFQAAVSHYEQVPMPMKAIEAREGLILAAGQLDSLSLAEKQLRAIASTYSELGNDERTAFAFYRLGLVQEELNKLEEATASYLRARSLYGSLGAPAEPRAKDIALRLERIAGQLT